MSETNFECPPIRSLLDEWLDGRLSLAESSRIEAHIEACPACRVESTELRALLAAAHRLPLAQAPARDLWPAVEARLSLGAPSPRRQGLAGPWSRGWFPKALAAGLSLIAVAAAYWLGMNQAAAPVAGSSVPGTVPGSVQRAVQGQDVADSLALLEAAFAETRQRLRLDLAGTAASRSLQNDQVVQQNLAVIEQAIDELRLALATEPENRQLQRLLLANYQKEVDLLTWAYRMPRG